MDIYQSWNRIREQIKDRVTGRNVWQALDVLNPIAEVDGTTVLGIPHSYSEYISYVSNVTTKRLIEQVIEEHLGEKRSILIIEGATQQDWEAYQRKQEEARRISEGLSAKESVARKSADSWEGLYEWLGRRYADTPNRSLAQNRAQYLQDAVEATRKLLEQTPIENEQDERQFNRVIERITTNTDVAPAMVGWLILYGGS
ncbi:MAG: hypothetical protein KIT45_03215 [Fimbriimonadia bacterium]|nr:hypothetical protein [Fimbriimonadia bacterium]